ncbi:MAG: ketoacyl-ACP synthase III [Deltaproteobacteria bacterium]|nr:ketoacyl-ACP synthase III [Deltaproteobacteria bacterium]
MGLRIVGWGTALPEKILTNRDLEAQLDTSDEWIRERTGIRERRIGDSTAVLAIEAGREALEHAGVDPASIDMLVLCTTTPDQTVPATSASVHEALGIGGGAFDLNAACAGFVYGMVTAESLLASNPAKYILLIGADVLSRITDWTDRSTAVLFGDGAGAVVLQGCSDEDGQLLASDVGADGKLRGILYADLGGKMKMEGPEVFKGAVRAMVASSKRVIESAGCRAEEIALLVPHQANLRIIEAACQRLGIPLERAAIVLDRTGNTSSASIPLALIDAIRADRLGDGDLVLLTGFGAGMTWASAVVRWRVSAR